ncbi:MAG: CDP-glucose 4,6-dehydratase [Chthoniobacterales bacterium]
MVNPTPPFWNRRRVLVTGHTGFKGTWLWQLLEALGAEPAGIALPPDTDPSLSALIGLPDHPRSHCLDIRDRDLLARTVQQTQPEIVFHLAAQALVRRSYEQPMDTYSTNVMGTIHLLEALRSTPSVRSIVVVTSDKVYQNQDRLPAYCETDPLGGHDPYSSSKACVELAVASWRLSFFAGKTPPVGVATVRAGNVVGGGDWARDRLVPDLIRAFTSRRPAQIRHPNAVRAWIHALEPLVGYLVLAERLWNDPDRFSEAWNFGPDDSQARSVENVVRQATELWTEGASWRPAETPSPHETMVLRLNIAKARDRLEWRPRLEFNQTLAWTMDWYRRWHAGADPGTLCREQIERYLATER